jgi:tape measure domain-containing protein
MATKIGDLYFDVSANTSAVNKALAGIGLAATAAAAIIATELVGAGAKFNQEMQRTTALFSALTGSVEVARDTMREFAGLSLDSPIFDAKTLSRAAQLLLTFDVAQEYVGELAENITLASVALGKGTQGATQLARAIGQIQGRGWLEGDEARQLSEVGINAYAVIAEAIGKTTGEVMELGRQSLLLAEDVIPILNDHLRETFGEVAPQLLNTFGVQVQGLGNIFKALGSAIVEPFIGAFSGGVLTTAVGDIREGLRGLVEEGGDGLFRLAGALEPFNDLLQSLADSVGEVAAKFSGWLSDATAGDALEGVVTALTMFGSEVKAALSGGIDLIQDVFSSLQPVFPAIRDFLGVLYLIARDAIPIVADGIRELADIIGIIGPDLLTAGAALAAVFGPSLLAILDASATALGYVADALDAIDNIAPAAAVAVGLVVAALFALNTQLAISAGASGLQALGLGLAGLGVQATALRLTLTAALPGVAAFVSALSAFAVPAALAVAGILAIDAAVQGLKGNMDLVTRDKSLLDPRAWLQDLPADAGIAIGELFGGVSEEELKARAETVKYLSDLEADAAALLPTISQGITSLEVFDAVLRSMSFDDPLLAGELRSQFKDFLITQDELAAAQKFAEEMEAALAIVAEIRALTAAEQADSSIFQDWMGFADSFKDLSNQQFVEFLGFEGVLPEIENATDLIKILETVADDAARQRDADDRPGASRDCGLGRRRCFHKINRPDREPLGTAQLLETGRVVPASVVPETGFWLDFLLEGR